MATRPVIYVVHGSWHGPAFFDIVKTKFRTLGYTMVCPQQPSTGASPPVTTMQDDAKFVRGELELLIEHGEEVVLVMLSYGGVVGTQAGAGLGRAERAQKGQSGGIVRLFYASAFLLPLGWDLCTPLGGNLAPFIVAKEDGSTRPDNAEHNFFNDLPTEDQKYWASKLRHQTVVSQKDPLTRVAYTKIPVTYLYCENDQVLHLPIQKMMVEQVKQAGIEVEEMACWSGHSPFLSQPDVFVQSVVRSFAAAANEGVA